MPVPQTKKRGAEELENSEPQTRLKVTKRAPTKGRERKTKTVLLTQGEVLNVHINGAKRVRASTVSKDSATTAVDLSCDGDTNVAFTVSGGGEAPRADSAMTKLLSQLNGLKMVESVRFLFTFKKF